MSTKTINDGITHSFPHQYLDIYHALTSVNKLVFSTGGIPMTGTFFGGSEKSRTRSIDDLTSKVSPMLADHFISTHIEKMEVVDISTSPKPLLRVNMVYKFQLVGSGSFILVPSSGQSSQPHKDTAIVSASSYALKIALLSLLGLNAGSTDDADVATPTQSQPSPGRASQKEQIPANEKEFLKKIRDSLEVIHSGEELRDYYTEIKDMMADFTDTTKSKVRELFQAKKNSFNS